MLSTSVSNYRVVSTPLIAWIFFLTKCFVRRQAILNTVKISWRVIKAKHLCRLYLLKTDGTKFADKPSLSANISLQTGQFIIINIITFEILIPVL